MVVNGKKLCSKCHIWKSVDSFRERSTYTDGLDCWCKKCNKKYYSEYRKKYPNKRKERYKQHPEEEKKKRREYYKSKKLQVYEAY